MEETHKLPFGYTVTFSYSTERSHPLQCEWEPDFPKDLSSTQRKKFLTSYCSVRDNFLKRVADERGENIMVFNVEDSPYPSERFHSGEDLRGEGESVSVKVTTGNGEDQIWTAERTNAKIH